MTRKIFLAMMLVLLGNVFLASSGEAVIVVQSMTGTAQALVEPEQTWKPLTEVAQLKAGDQIMTEAGSTIDLLCEDGSEIHLAENTQIAFTESEFSADREVRMTKIMLVAGTVTVNAESYAFQNNTFEVKSETVTVSFKETNFTMGGAAGENGNSSTDVAFEGSKLTMTVLPGQNGESPTTTVSPVSGNFTVTRVGQGTTTVECLLGDGKGGIAFDMGENAAVNIGIDPTTGTLALNSDEPLNNVSVLESQGAHSFRLVNAGTAPVQMNIGGNIVQCNPGSTATVNLDGNNVSVKAETSGISMNGKELKPEEESSAAVTSGSSSSSQEPAAYEEKPEVPVAPPAAANPPTENSASPVKPTP